MAAPTPATGSSPRPERGLESHRGPRPSQRRAPKGSVCGTPARPDAAPHPPHAVAPAWLGRRTFPGTPVGSRASVGPGLALHPRTKTSCCLNVPTGSPPFGSPEAVVPGWRSVEKPRPGCQPVVGFVCRKHSRLLQLSGGGFIAAKGAELPHSHPGIYCGCFNELLSVDGGEFMMFSHSRLPKRPSGLQPHLSPCPATPAQSTERSGGRPTNAPQQNGQRMETAVPGSGPQAGIWRQLLECSGCAGGGSAGVGSGRPRKTTGHLSKPNV